MATEKPFPPDNVFRQILENAQAIHQARQRETRLIKEELAQRPERQIPVYKKNANGDYDTTQPIPHERKQYIDKLLKDLMDEE